MNTSFGICILANRKMELLLSDWVLSIVKKQNWGIAVGGVSARYRIRIPFFAKFSLSTQLICRDGRWFHFLHETYRENKIWSSALIEVGITSKDGLVPAHTVTKEMGYENWGNCVGLKS